MFCLRFLIIRSEAWLSSSSWLNRSNTGCSTRKERHHRWISKYYQSMFYIPACHISYHLCSSFDETRTSLAWHHSVLMEVTSVQRECKKTSFLILKFNYSHRKAVTKEVVLVYMNEAPLHCVTGGYKETGHSPGPAQVLIWKAGLCHWRQVSCATPNTATWFCKVRSLWLMAIYQNKVLTSTDKCTAGRHVASSISQFEEAGEKRRLSDRFEKHRTDKSSKKGEEMLWPQLHPNHRPPTFVLQ